MNSEEVLTTTIGKMSQTSSQLPTHNFDPRSTPEQVIIYEWVVDGSGNLIIRARAGSGKTTTLVEISKLLPQNTQSTFLAFNVHIKKELQKKLPKNVFCYTTHGLGLSAIMRKYKDVVVDKFKVDKLINKHIKGWNLAEIDNLSLYIKNMKKMINLVRTTLTLNKKYVPDLCDRYDVKFDGQDVDRMFKILEEMLNDKKTIDYTDMIYLPVVDNKIWLFPQDYVLVDEAQDLSKAQHELIKKCVKKDKAGKYIGRMIYVGDDMQAIYGFTGSDAYSFNNLARIPNTIVLPLTTTFRCGKNIVKEANTIVTDIRPLDGAIDGIVRNGSAIDEAEAGDFVLSRKTFPLVKLFFELLVQGRKSYIKGSDIGEALIDFTNGKNSMSQLDASLTNSLSEYREQLNRHGVTNHKDDTGYVALNDKIKILRFLMTMVQNIDDLKQRIQYIFKKDYRIESEGDDVVEILPEDSIILSTVHKAKGLEANRVFIIMPKDMPLRTSQPWQYQQEMNLKYIAITRAKQELVYDVDWTVDDGTFESFKDD